jgi:hypothetical protein
MNMYKTIRMNHFINRIRKQVVRVNFETTRFKCIKSKNDTLKDTEIKFDSKKIINSLNVNKWS